MVRAIVTSRKHIIQNSLLSTASGAVTNITLANVVDRSAANTNLEIVQGSIIKAVYLEYWHTGDDAVQGSMIAVLEKLVAGATPIAAGQIAALDSYDNKRNVLHTFMGLLGPNTQVPMTSVKGWFKIPKGKQRFSVGDKLTFSVFGQSDGVITCGFAIYKEYT